MAAAMLHMAVGAIAMAQSSSLPALESLELRYPEISSLVSRCAFVQAPTAFLNVTHVVGQPLPFTPNAPPLQTPTPGFLAPPPPPGGMMLPSLLPGTASGTILTS